MRTWYGPATAVVLLALSPNPPTNANVKTREIEYRQGETVLQGFVAWDDAARGRKPGVLVVHEWWGHNEHARNRRGAWPRRAMSASPSTCTARAKSPAIPRRRRRS